MTIDHIEHANYKMRPYTNSKIHKRLTAYHKAASRDSKRPEKHASALFKFYGSPVNIKVHDQKYQTSNQTYSEHDVSEAIVTAKESRNKGIEFQRTHFNFGFLSNSPARTAIAMKHRLPQKYFSRRGNKIHRNKFVSLQLLMLIT